MVNDLKFLILTGRSDLLWRSFSLQALKAHSRLERDDLALYGGQIATPLELFDWLASDVETIQAWNEAIKAFLAQEPKLEALSVRL